MCKVCLSGGRVIGVVSPGEPELLVLDSADGLDLRGLAVGTPVLPVLIVSAVPLTLHDVLPSPVSWELVTHKTTHRDGEMRVRYLSVLNKSNNREKRLTRRIAHAWSPLQDHTIPWPAERGSHHTAPHSGPWSSPSRKWSCDCSCETEGRPREIDPTYPHIQVIISVVLLLTKTITQQLCVIKKLNCKMLCLVNQVAKAVRRT